MHELTKTVEILRFFLRWAMYSESSSSQTGYSSAQFGLVHCIAPSAISKQCHLIVCANKAVDHLPV
jgi:hypothetical protein